MVHCHSLCVELIFHQQSIALKNTALSKEKVEEVIDRVLHELPVDTVQEKAFTFDDYIVSVREIDSRIQTIRTGVLHLHELRR